MPKQLVFVLLLCGLFSSVSSSLRASHTRSSQSDHHHHHRRSVKNNDGSGAKRLVVLVLGSTGQLGTEIVRRLCSTARYHVYIINRRAHGALASEALCGRAGAKYSEVVASSRAAALAMLPERIHFDAVVDNSAFHAGAVRDVVEELQRGSRSTARYVLISSMSACDSEGDDVCLLLTNVCDSHDDAEEMSSDKDNDETGIESGNKAPNCRQLCKTHLADVESRAPSFFRAPPVLPEGQRRSYDYAQQKANSELVASCMWSFSSSASKSKSHEKDEAPLMAPPLIDVLRPSVIVGGELTHRTSGKLMADRLGYWVLRLDAFLSENEKTLTDDSAAEPRMLIPPLDIATDAFVDARDIAMYIADDLLAGRVEWAEPCYWTADVPEVTCRVHHMCAPSQTFDTLFSTIASTLHTNQQQKLAREHHLENEKEKEKEKEKDKELEGSLESLPISSPELPSFLPKEKMVVWENYDYLPLAEMIPPFSCGKAPNAPITYRPTASTVEYFLELQKRDPCFSLRRRHSSGGGTSSDEEVSCTAASSPIGWFGMSRNDEDKILAKL